MNLKPILVWQDEGGGRVWSPTPFWRVARESANQVPTSRLSNGTLTCTIAHILYHFKTQIPSAFIINSKSLRRCSPKKRLQALQMRQLEWNKLSSCLSSLTQSREQIWCLWSLVNPWSGLWVDWSVEAAFIWLIAGSGVTIGDSLCCHLVHWLLPVGQMLSAHSRMRMMTLPATQVTKHCFETMHLRLRVSWK